MGYVLKTDGNILELGSSGITRTSKGVEFDPLLREAGSNAFAMGPTRWVEPTNAVDIICKSGAIGGPYAGCASDGAEELAGPAPLLAPQDMVVIPAQRAAPPPGFPAATHGIKRAQSLKNRYHSPLFKRN